MRRALLAVMFLSAALPAAAGLYKHVDADGKVTYSDRPSRPEQKPIELPPVNVASPEARRQMMIARAAFEREAQADIQYRQMLAAAAYRYEPAPSSYAPSYPYRYAGGTYGAYGTYGPYYSVPVYYVGYARTPAQGHPPQGLRTPGVS